jgi:hypothetical protein
MPERVVYLDHAAITALDPRVLFYLHRHGGYNFCENQHLVNIFAACYNRNATVVLYFIGVQFPVR